METVGQSSDAPPGAFLPMPMAECYGLTLRLARIPYVPPPTTASIPPVISAAIRRGSPTNASGPPGTT